MSLAPTASAAPRALFIDWLRIIALGLLVPYHVGMYYVSWGWHVKSPNLVPALEPLMRMSSPWRMSLLFVVSGAATALMLERFGGRPPGGGWLRERAARLLLPLVLGMLLVVPPQSYFEVVQKGGYAGSYLDFMALYLTAYGGFCEPGGGCLVLPTWNHLWFLPYLFVYTLLLWLLLRRRPQALEAGGAGLERWLAGARLVWLPVVLLWLYRVAIGAHFPTTHALVDDPFSHAQFLTAFAFGALAARQGALWQRIESLRWPALIAAVAGWAAWVALGGAPFPVRALAVSVEQWGALLAAIGFAHRHLTHDGPARRWLTDAVFPVYLLHQTLIVVLAMAWRPLGLPPAVEGPLLVAATLLLGAAGYRVVRRLGGLRPWFGLKRLPAADRAPPPAARLAR